MAGGAQRKAPGRLVEEVVDHCRNQQGHKDTHMESSGDTHQFGCLLNRICLYAGGAWVQERAADRKADQREGNEVHHDRIDDFVRA